MTTEDRAPSLQGRLELTWTNKHKRLLAHEDESYEWTSPSDYRVAEVRLLHDVTAVGKVHPNKERAKDNLLVRGDALHALTSLERLPEFSREYAGKVKLVYIDPPFNTGQAFANYDDALEHSVWLTLFRDRLIQLRSLMSADASIWVHLDDAEVHRARCVMDEVFGTSAFVGTVVWENFYGRSNAAAISPCHNYLLVYAPIGKEKWRHIRNLLPRDPKSASKYANPDSDPRGDWRNGPIFAPEERHDGLMYTVTTPSGRTVKPPAGSHWRMTEPEFWKMVEEGRITFGQDGNGIPAVKLFLNEVQDGLVPRSCWPHTEAGHSQEAKREIQALFPDVAPFATPKPERLMERIIRIATSTGDIVLDCFAGSGTTAAVSHKMSRRWVTVEWSRDNTANFILPRLTEVVGGTDKGGVSAVHHWEGGGSFRVLEVAPSMFDVRDGRIVLAAWATDEALAEAVAAQAGFDYTPDDAPFCGRKGRQRLAVIDGLVSPDVAALLVPWLADDEVLVVYGTAVDPDTREALTSLRRGSLVRKVPQTILTAYRKAASRDTMFTPPPPVVAEGEGE